MKSKKVIILQYSIATAILIGFFLTYAFSNDLFNQKDIYAILTILSNGFFVAGMILVLSGLLTLIGKTGFFDVMGFGFVSLKTLFSPRKDAMENRIHYYDYKVEKESKERHWYPFLCITGGISVVIGFILFIIYMCV